MTLAAYQMLMWIVHCSRWCAHLEHRGIGYLCSVNTLGCRRPNWKGSYVVLYRYLQAAGHMAAGELLPLLCKHPNPEP